MKGFGVVESGKRVGWIEKDIPRPGRYEALARPVAIAPCTSDVHLAGRPVIPDGRILGHEVVAEIVEVGEGVTERRPGDLVAAGATTPEWRAAAVQDNLHQNTGGTNAGMIWASRRDGVFAEYFTIRDVDLNTALIPEGVSVAQALMVGDMVTTGFYGVELGEVAFGDTVVVCGIGPVGLMSVVGAVLRGAARVIAVGNRPATMELARTYGATECIDYKTEDIARRVDELTGGEGADCCILAGGNAQTFVTCLQVVKSGGILANLVAQGNEILIPPVPAGSWCAHKTIRGGLCPGGRRRLERLLAMIQERRFDPELLVTQRFHGLENIEQAYRLMEHKNNDVIKPIVYLD